MPEPSANGWIGYWNGRFVRDEEICISPSDRGFMLGDAVYEVTRTFGHALFHLDWHLDRLFTSLRYLGIDPRLTEDQLAELTLTVLRRNLARLDPRGDASLTHRITRGPFAGLFTGPPAGPPTVIVTCRPIAFARFAEFYSTGVGLKIPSLRLPAAGGTDPRAKTHNKLHHVLGDAEMWPQGRNVLPLFADVAGYVTESIASNVFFVMRGCLVTPPDEVVLAGITRRVVVQLAEEMRLDVLRRPVHLDELGAVDEAFVTGTSFSILPVRWLNGGDLRPVPGPVTQALTAVFSRVVGIDIIEQSRART